MFCDCLYWNQGISELESESKPFSLPSPLLRWPQGRGFATGMINLGEIEVVKVTEFDRVWKCGTSRGKSMCASFYKPVGILEGFHCLGHYCKPNNQPLRGFVLAARGNKLDDDDNLPPLIKPLNYSLVWRSDSDKNGCCYFWLPIPPVGYRAVGVIVTDKYEEPEVEEVRCVREDLTESCEAGEMIVGVGSFNVWSTEPCERGIQSRSIAVGSFFCFTNDNKDAAMSIACLKNLDPSLPGMPNLDQVHALIQHYAQRSTSTRRRLTCHRPCHGSLRMEHCCTVMGNRKANRLTPRGLIFLWVEKMMGHSGLISLKTTRKLQVI